VADQKTAREFETVAAVYDLRALFILALIERRYNEGTLAPGKIRAQ
jgi:hypothetical protein